MELLNIIIAAIVSLAGGGGIAYYITLKEQKERAKLDNKQLEADINGTITDNMVKIFDQVQDQNQKFMEQLNIKDDIIAEKDKIIEEKNTMILQLTADLAASNSFMCKNDLCPLRDPAKGLGPLAFQEMKEKGEIKGNQINIYDLAKKKGYTVEREICQN